MVVHGVIPVQGGGPKHGPHRLRAGGAGPLQGVLASRLRGYGGPCVTPGNQLVAFGRDNGP
ncbi:hypothetical protein NY78_2274 [Desulfovibrio sp. TomC]|nr:hypothetical protein NY78_2274 [Desulfovibrio sp. TomC]